MKKYFLCTMIACIAFVMPNKVKAAEAYAALSNDNTTLTFYYDNEKSSRNGMDIGPFTSENGKERGWHGQRKTITSVVFDNSFADYGDLTSTRCWFVELTNLTTISGIENLKTSNVTDMGFMFTECYGLTNIDVSHFDTRNVNNMDAMFAVCTNLTSLDLSNFDTGNVYNMKSVFECCYALKSLNISSFNTSNVTNMAYMFGDCYALENLDVSKFNTDNVTQMDIMFRACKNLKVLDLSSFNTSKVTNMGQMFKNCEELTTIYVSDNWTIENAEWKSEENDKSKSIFYGCPKLVGGNGTTWDENHIDHTYAHIDGGPTNPGYLTLKTGDIPDINTDKVEAYAALSNDNTTLTFYYDDKKSSRNGMDIGPFERAKERGWHNYAKSITTVAFDNSFANLTELTSTAYWFSTFQDLTTISGIENLKTNNVTDMSAMFHECLSLTSVDVRNFDTRNVKNMEGMFAECESLQSIDLGNFDTRNVENMLSMFAECKTIQTIDLSSFNTEKVTTMAGMLGDCYLLTDVNVSSFNTSNVTDMKRMFYRSKVLTVLDLSNFNTSNVTNMKEMFSLSPMLTTIYVSKEWSTEKVEKGENVFDGCNSIVGGGGTIYDANHTDYSYAHIDGGASNPGYLTYKDVSPKEDGDANGDGNVGAADIVELVNYIIGNLSNNINEKAADVNGDGVVNIADIVQIIYIILRTK